MDSLELCSVKGCRSYSTVIVNRILKGGEIDKRNYNRSLILGYCQFHAIIAESLFGESDHRKEMKGISI
jgi:hypothetical protein